MGYENGRREVTTMALVNPDTFANRLKGHFDNAQITIFDPMSYALERTETRISITPNSLNKSLNGQNSDNELFKKIGTFELKSELGGELKLPVSYVGTMEKVSRAILGSGKQIQALDNPGKFTRLIAEICADPDSIENLNFNTGYGGNGEVSPRFLAYVVPLLTIAKQFQESHLPSPQLTLFNGVNAAIAVNHNNNPERAKRLIDVREKTHKLVDNFITAFAPGVQIRFKNDPEWTPEYVERIDQNVEMLGYMAQNSPALRKIIYELASSAASHMHPENGTNYMLGVMRYIAIHPWLFEDLYDPTDAERNPKRRSINIINPKEIEFGAARRAFYDASPSSEHGARVSDLVLRKISRQIPPYYFTGGVDRKLGSWRSYCNNPLDQQQLMKTAETYVQRAQREGALVDWMAIAEFIDPQDPQTGMNTYYQFLAEFESQNTN